MISPQDQEKSSEAGLVDVRRQSATDPPSAVPHSHPHGPPPDGGVLAWVQVAAAFFVLMNTWGLINTFGAFQNFYEVDILSSHSPSSISWIGSMQGFLLLFVGALTGPIFDAGYIHALLGVGSVVVVFSIMMTSLAKSYYQAFLAQGVCFGIGAGMLFIPSMAVVTTYFDRHRSLAVGVTASGSSLGGVIYPTIFHVLQPRVGFPWATRIIGFIALVTLAFSNLFMRPRVMPAMRRKLVDFSALREVPFVLFTAGLFFGFMALYIPFDYITPFALAKTGAGASLAFYYVPILNAASTFGRLVPNALADHIGPMNTIAPATLACGVLAFAWMGIHNTGGLLTFAIMFGFFSGSFLSLPAGAIVALSADLRTVGTRLGMSFAIAGFGLLIGSPVGGALLNLDTSDLNAGHYIHAQAFCAVILTVSGVMLLLARVARSGTAIMVKA
ncbi:MFS general substrate transporter [Gloeopeniophorella convolvens]|nr:MFS general substrate transporter [Gloeopeniophorella convolvens]